jgi:hypothetical protein
MLVPWRRAASWHCEACGRCCLEYTPKLTFYEFLKLKDTGFVVEKSGRYYIRKIGRRCPFQIGRFCRLQNDLKPLSCRLFPFSIHKRGEEEALYEYMGEELFVYVDPFCKNVRLGRATKSFEELVRDAVSIAYGKKKFGRLTASLLNSQPELPPSKPSSGSCRLLTSAAHP